MCMAWRVKGYKQQQDNFPNALHVATKRVRSMLITREAQQKREGQHMVKVKTREGQHLPGVLFRWFTNAQGRNL
jgi:hypothetical protein